MPSLLAQFPMDDNFLNQVGSSLSEIETSLNRLGQASDNSEALEEAYRCTHTISSSASLNDFMGLSQVAHAIADVLGDALDEVLSLDQDALGLLRRSLERARLIVERMKTGAGAIERIVAEDAADHAAFC